MELSTMANQIIVESGTGNITVTTSRSVIGTVANVASANYANFAGQIVDANQPNITQVGTLTGLVVGGNITPNANVTYNLGNNTNRFNDLYLSNSTIYLGAQEISANASAAIFNGNVAADHFIGNGNFANVAVTGTINTQDLIVNGNLAVGNLVANNANYANYAGNAYSVNGANVSGSVANANYANVAGTAYSVAVGNVSGIGNIATINLDGNVSNVLHGDGSFGPEGTTGNANYANFAGNAFSVDGANVNGAVANANYANFAGTAYNVSGANVSGIVANANYANISGTAYSVSGSNVSGAVANATYAANAGNANIANTAYSVSLANVSGAGNIASINLDGNASNLLNGAGSFVAIPTSVANANYANFAGTAYSVSGSNVSGEVANANYASYAANVTSASQPNITSVGNLTGLTVNGNLNVANTLLLSNTVQVTSPGYYLPYGFYYSGGMPNNNVIFTVAVNGDVTNGSNVMNNVTLSEVNTGTPLNLANYASYLSNLSLIPTLNFDTGYINTNIPLLGTISNVDVANSTITYSNNFTGTNNITVQTAVTLYDTSKNAYFGSTRFVLGQGFNTYASNNEIVMDTVDPIDFGIGPGAPIQFIGTTFGGITANTTYYVDTVVSGNTAITISDSQYGPTKTLSDGSGTMMVVDASTDTAQTASLSGKTVRPNYNTFFAGPFNTLPTYANLSTTTNPNFASTPTIVWRYSKSLNINNNTPTEAPTGFIANIQYNQLVGPTVVGTLAAPTITGEIYDQFGINGITAVNSGNDANLTGLRTAFSTLSYTDGGSDSASVTNPGNPPGFQMTTYTGNASADINERYLRSGRVIGRIAYYAAQKVNGAYYVPPGSSPQAGIYVQALGNWDSSVNTSLPMVFALQYSPLNAAGSSPNYTRINRTFLQAANNTTTIGGATNIEFRPLARSNSATNNRSPSALGNVSINPQKFVDISGYTQGNAVSNGAGAVLNVTTTASTWNGDVALRLSRTVNNTANMEFKLPVGSANTMTLVDNASGNTLATFTDGYANFTGQLNSLRTYASFYNPNDIAITANTVANLDLTNTYSANGVSIVSNNQITIARAGTYNIQMSLQLTNSDNASEHDFDVWFAKNGTDIADSATQYTVIKNNGKNVVALNFIDTAAANDYYQIRYASQSANISLEAFASQSTPYVRPAIPSAIVTVVPVGA
jgi:hypothetical protein